MHTIRRVSNLKWEVVFWPSGQEPRVLFKGLLDTEAVEVASRLNGGNWSTLKEYDESRPMLAGAV